MQDIFEYARGIVNNKSVAARIGHSAKLHSVRSALSSKGSFGSKAVSLLGSAARATLNAIPLPAVGSLVSSVESAIQKYYKGEAHKSRLAEATAKKDTENIVKFELKELSVEELDRFRWKVVHSISDLNTAINKFPANFTKKRDEAATCDAYLELALAAEQASRRIRKLKDQCVAINAVIRTTCDWIEECDRGPKPAGAVVAVAALAPAAPATAGVLGKKNDIQRMIMSHIQSDDQDLATGDHIRQTEIEKRRFRAAYVAAYHAKCDKWCCYREAGTVDDYASYKDSAAKAMRFLSSPFIPDDFNNNLGSLWKN